MARSRKEPRSTTAGTAGSLTSTVDMDSPWVEKRLAGRIRLRRLGEPASAWRTSHEGAGLSRQSPFAYRPQRHTGFSGVAALVARRPMLPLGIVTRRPDRPAKGSVGPARVSTLSDLYPAITQ